MSDESDKEIEIVKEKEKEKPQSLLNILIIMFLAIIVLGVLIIGGLKFYKKYKNEKSTIAKQTLPKLEKEEKSKYIESLALPLKIPEHLEKPPMAKGKIVSVNHSVSLTKSNSNQSDIVDYSKLPYEKSDKESKNIEKKKKVEEVLNEIIDFQELEKAIISLKIKRVENKIMVGERSYKENESLGNNFIIRKIYPNGKVKIFNIKEDYAKRFSL